MPRTLRTNLIDLHRIVYVPGGCCKRGMAGLVSLRAPRLPAAWVILHLLLTSSLGAELQKFEYSADAMGGNFSIVLYSTSRPNADAAAEAAFVELRRLDSVLSNYRQESEWSAVNRNAAEQPVKVTPELFNLLSACLEYSRLSEGAFDISVGPLMKAWNFYGGEGKLLDDDGVREALAHVGYSRIQLDPEARTVQFARAQMELDPGGIGKGYAVDRMIEEMKRHGIERALLSAAGSTIYALGTPPGREGWLVRISSPDKPDLDACQLLLKDESLSTSGISRKSFRVDGRIYSHMLDPRTGYPASGVLLAAVVAPRAIDSEAWTKGFFVNGRAWTARHIPVGFKVFLCGEESRHPRCTWIP